MLVSLAVLAAGVSPARAQESAPSPPPADEDLHEDDVLEVVVEATSATPQATTVLGEEALDRAAGDDLAETLATVPGVVAARGTSDATKPVIRGQLERRLLVLFDGVRHESQKWGADHATEIDPFAAGTIQVIRGAAGVRYGPDAIGGVILVEPPPMRTERGFGGKAELIGGWNALRGVAALRLDAAPNDTWSFRVEANYGRGGVVSAPDYPLGNTASETWNAGLSAQYAHDDRTLRVTARHYDLRAGVCFCARSASSGDFLQALSAEVPLGSDRWTTGFGIERPYQAVAHDLAALHYTEGLGSFGLFTATYAFQLDRRKEFEQVRESVTGPQYDFLLRTHTLDLGLTKNPTPLGGGTVEGGGGAEILFQENVYNGLPLIPNHRAATGGGYAWGRWSVGRLSTEVGGRLDAASRTVFLSPQVYAADLARGVLSEGDCDAGDTSARCGHRWTAGSLSAGGVLRLVPDALDLRLDLSSASRFPSPDELYSNGTAPTLPVYAVGDPSLGAETTWGATPTLSLTLPVVQVELSAFANRTDDFVLFAPELGPGGQIVFDVTIQGAFPRFTYRSVDARFSGVDGQVAVRVARTVTAGIQGSLVRGVDRGTGAPLPFVPPDRVRGSLGYRSVREHTFAEVRADWLGRAKASPADLAPPPDPAVLLGAEIGQDVHLGGRKLELSLEVENALDARYRDATSLLRYFADEPGRQLRLRIGSTF